MADGRITVEISARKAVVAVCALLDSRKGTSMTKTEALNLFGGTSKLAAAIGVTPQAISMWPDVLTELHVDRVQAALWRQAQGGARSHPPRSSSAVTAPVESARE